MTFEQVPGLGVAVGAEHARRPWWFLERHLPFAAAGTAWCDPATANYTHQVHNRAHKAFRLAERQPEYRDYRPIRLARYKIPQSRRRLVLVGSRHGPIHLPDETHGPPGGRLVARLGVGGESAARRPTTARTGPLVGATAPPWKSRTETGTDNVARLARPARLVLHRLRQNPGNCTQTLSCSPRS